MLQLSLSVLQVAAMRKLPCILLHSDGILSTVVNISRFSKLHCTTNSLACIRLLVLAFNIFAHVRFYLQWHSTALEAYCLAPPATLLVLGVLGEHWLQLAAVGLGYN